MISNECKVQLIISVAFSNYMHNRSCCFQFKYVNALAPSILLQGETTYLQGILYVVGEVIMKDDRGTEG